jgi:hypothetical protein
MSHEAHKGSATKDTPEHKVKNQEWKEDLFLCDLCVLRGYYFVSFVAPFAFLQVLSPMEPHMNRILLSLLLVAVAAPAAPADLRFTTRVEVRRTSTSVTSVDPVATAAVLQSLMPPGETRTFVTGDAIRIEQTIGPTPSVVLIRPDGQFIVYPELRTYWRMPPGDRLAGSRSTAQTTFRRTGEVTTMLGVQAERISVTLPLVLPVTPPAGFPTRMTFEGEIWVADVYRAEGRGVQKALGLTVLPPGVEGMVLRQILRNAEFGYEVESTVIELVEAPTPGDMFLVPAGYREINQPVAPEVAPGGSRRTQP